MNLWLGMALIVLGALPFLIYPWMRRAAPESGGSDREHANVALFREQCRGYEQQVLAGEISSAQQSQLVAEAEQLLLSNTERQDSKFDGKAGRWLLPVLMLTLPLFSVGLYEHLGAAPDQEIVELIQQRNKLLQAGVWREANDDNLTVALQRQVERHPENIYYWTLLAQFALDRGEMAGARNYLSRAIEQAPGDPWLLAQYAQTLFFLAENRFTPEVTGALARAYAADPGNATTLGLKGIEAYQAADYKQAIDYWRRALRGLAPDTEGWQALHAGIQQASKQLGEMPAPAVAQSSSVRIHVSLAPAVDYQPDQSVFVAVVEASGPPMPLVARKIAAVELPATLELTDADALMAGRNLSSAASMRVVARLSRSGSATPQAGDWETRSEPFALVENRAEVNLVIDRQL